MPFILLSSTGFALANPWTQAGSVGVVDESNTALVEFRDTEARLKASAPVDSTAVVRYNVVSLEGLEGVNQPFAFRVRFLDNGSGARTQVVLKRYRLGFAPDVVATIDSIDYPAQAGYQTQSKCYQTSWNFLDSVYYVEATLAKNALGGEAGVAAIQILPGYCGEG